MRGRRTANPNPYQEGQPQPFLFLLVVLLFFPTPFGAAAVWSAPSLGGVLLSLLLLRSGASLLSSVGLCAAWSPPPFGGVAFQSPFRWCCLPFPPLGGATFSLSSVGWCSGWCCFSPSIFFLGAPRKREGILTTPTPTPNREDQPDRKKKRSKATQDHEGRRKPSNSDQLTPTLWGGAAFLKEKLRAKFFWFSLQSFQSEKKIGKLYKMKKT